MVDHYKWDENAFISAKEWLEEYDFEIILYSDSPVQAIGFMTGLDEIIEKNKIIYMNVELTQLISTKFLFFYLFRILWFIINKYKVY
jgi:hypothetical protein